MFQTVAEWAAIGDSFLAGPKDRQELDALAAAALRIGIQATSKAGAWKDEQRVDDDELLTPKRIHDALGPSMWSIREWMRRNPTLVWRSHAGAVRGLMVRRGIARAWVAGLSK